MMISNELIITGAIALGCLAVMVASVLITALVDFIKDVTVSNW